MKIGDRLMKLFGRITCKHSLKIPKCYSTVIEVPCAFRLIKTQGPLYVQKYSPKVMRTVFIVIPPVTGFHYIQRLSVGISTLLSNYFTQILCHIHHIIHKLLRFFEN